MDSLILRRLIVEYQHLLRNGVIRHVQQLDAHTIALKISPDMQTLANNTDVRSTVYLLISSHAVHARTHLLPDQPKGQKQSHFAEFLFRHLARSVITDIQQIGWDRIMQITVQPYAELLEPGPKSLMVELMGKHSNIILVDQSTGKILESIKHIDDSMSRVRTVEPGEPYQLPPQFDKADPLELDVEGWFEIFIDTSLSWRKLMQAIDGISPAIAKEIIYRANCESFSLGITGALDSQSASNSLDLEQAWLAFDQVRAEWTSEANQPQIVTDDQQSLVSTIALQQLAGATSQYFETVSDAVYAYYYAIEQKEVMQRQFQALRQMLKRRQQAVERKLNQLWDDLETADRAEVFRQQGELLTANLHRIKPGQVEVEVLDYYDSDLKMRKLRLDPGMSPSQNAQQLFKQYTKAKRGWSVIQQLVSDNEAELEVIDHYRIQVETADTVEDLLSIRSQLAGKGWISDKSGPKNRNNQGETTFRRYTSPDGFQIYVGRNSNENDLLLRRVAKSNDMWLHARQIHGSHVIIRNPERKPGIPMPTLLLAAQIAAANSKAKHSSHVPVDYTWFKYVMKRRGAGFVHYTHQKTLSVEPRVL